MLIAVDAVGGDFYPGNPVKGAVEAINELSDIEVLLAGPEELIKKELDSLEYNSKKIHILHAPEIISMEESPASAVKNKRNSSIVTGISVLKQGECSAFVSAGNTGALLAASTFLLGKLEGVLRPTIASIYPTIRGNSLLVDAGANLELKSDMYLQFAKMSEIFASEIMDIESPTIGLLNVGEEPEKGTDLLKEVYGRLSKLDNFIGNVEGKEILYGKADVYLTDGFTGNILLKYGESIPDILAHMLKTTMAQKGVDEDSQKFVFQMISETLNSFNYEHVGGVPFLGVNGISLVGHGGSSITAIKNMIRNAAECIKHDMNQKIVSSLNN